MSGDYETLEINQPKISYFQKRPENNREWLDELINKIEDMIKTYWRLLNERKRAKGIRKIDLKLKSNKRKIHKKVAAISAIPLLVIIMSGTFYGFLQPLLGIDAFWLINWILLKSVLLISRLFTQYFWVLNL